MGRIEEARADLAAYMASLRGSEPGLAALTEAQLAGLVVMQQRVAFANGAALANIRQEVAALTSAAQSAAQQGRPASAEAQGSLQCASAAARRQVQGFLDDYYEKKIFEPYLTFASAEDEAAFRKREAERRAAIDKAMAEQTPEGDLRAARLSEQQLLDAGAHGADRSPDYQTKLAEMQTSKNTLEAAITPPEQPAASTDPMAALRAAGVTVADSTTPSAPPGGAGKARTLG